MKEMNVRATGLPVPATIPLPPQSRRSRGSSNRTQIRKSHMPRCEGNEGLQGRSEEVFEQVVQLYRPEPRAQGRRGCSWEESKQSTKTRDVGINKIRNDAIIDTSFPEHSFLLLGKVGFMKFDASDIARGKEWTCPCEAQAQLSRVISYRMHWGRSPPPVLLVYVIQQLYGYSQN
ncbi:hypothetical protein BGW80DRAFT_1447238 [Lactifluus volemus]|nr:hypothetical protein BGW80DRAFT_1447238 [Lactifluus volemus]